MSEPESAQRSTALLAKLLFGMLAEPPCWQELARCSVAWEAPSLGFFSPSHSTIYQVTR